MTCDAFEQVISSDLRASTDIFGQYGINTFCFQCFEYLDHRYHSQLSILISMVVIFKYLLLWCSFISHSDVFSPMTNSQICWPDRQSDGWLVIEKPYPSEKWWSEFVSWDDDIPNMMGKIIQPCSSHHQPAIIILDSILDVFSWLGQTSKIISTLDLILGTLQ